MQFLYNAFKKAKGYEHIPPWDRYVSNSINLGNDFWLTGANNLDNISEYELAKDFGKGWMYARRTYDGSGTDNNTRYGVVLDDVLFPSTRLSGGLNVNSEGSFPFYSVRHDFDNGWNGVLERSEQPEGWTNTIKFGRNMDSSDYDITYSNAPYESKIMVNYNLSY